jgi:hypothetical protein
MVLRIDPYGQVTCIYDEAIDLSLLGSQSIRRASQVEPDESGQWWADLGPVNGPRRGPYPRRSDALAAEQSWLETHIINGARTDLR